MREVIEYLLDKFTEWIRKASSLSAGKYAVIYLSMIPAFGLLFLYIQDDFKYSTIKSETSVIQEIQNIEAGILNHAGKAINKVDKAIDPSIRFYRRNGGEFEIVLLARYNPVEVGYFEGRFGFEEFKKVPQKIIEEPFLTVGESLLQTTTPPAKMNIFGSYTNGKKEEVPFRFLIDRADYEYIESVENFGIEPAGRNSAGLVRMLYLSTVTITTLGYGDILPITNLSRTLVAFESILGIVVIGLFLNAVSRQVSLRPLREAEAQDAGREDTDITRTESQHQHKSLKSNADGAKDVEIDQAEVPNAERLLAWLSENEPPFVFQRGKGKKWQVVDPRDNTVVSSGEDAQNALLRFFKIRS